VVCDPIVRIRPCDGLQTGIAHADIWGCDAAACCEADCLADQTRFLQKGDLRPLWSIGIVTGESTAISGNASPIAESPSAPSGTVGITEE